MCLDPYLVVETRVREVDVKGPVYAEITKVCYQPMLFSPINTTNYRFLDNDVIDNTYNYRTNVTNKAALSIAIFYKIVFVKFKQMKQFQYF